MLSVDLILYALQVSDISLSDYVGVVAAKHATYVPHTSGRYSVKRFRKAQCPIVERLTNSLMMHGRNNGKKLMAVRIIKHAMEIIHLLTDLNPIQVIVDAVVNRYTNENEAIYLIQIVIFFIVSGIIFCIYFLVLLLYQWTKGRCYSYWLSWSCQASGCGYFSTSTCESGYLSPYYRCS